MTSSNSRQPWRAGWTYSPEPVGTEDTSHPGMRVIDERSGQCIVDSEAGEYNSAIWALFWIDSYEFHPEDRFRILCAHDEVCSVAYEADPPWEYFCDLKPGDKPLYWYATGGGGVIVYLPTGEASCLGDLLDVNGGIAIRQRRSRFGQMIGQIGQCIRYA